MQRICLSIACKACTVACTLLRLTTRRPSWARAKAGVKQTGQRQYCVVNSVGCVCECVCVCVCVCVCSQSERETQLQQLEDVLLSLWQAVGVAEKAPERANIVAAMTGPNRLHADRMEKVQIHTHTQPALTHSTTRHFACMQRPTFFEDPRSHLRADCSLRVCVCVCVC